MTTYTNIQRNAIDYTQYGYGIYGTSKYGARNPYTNVPKSTIAGGLTWEQAAMRWSEAQGSWGSVGYTTIAKPSGVGTITIGMATGLITPPTYSKSYGIDTNYTLIAKPTT